MNQMGIEESQAIKPCRYHSQASALLTGSSYHGNRTYSLRQLKAGRFP